MSRGAIEQPRAVWACSTCGAVYHKDFPRCPADGGVVAMTDRDPLLGAVIGHYSIDELIGEGGMGRVYLAHHAHLPNKRYAFKVLLGDHGASAAMRTRFTREAERASQLDHPNVVKVVDFGQTAHGLLYIVMEYVDGPSLVALIGEAPMAPAKVVELSRAICQGLAYAHDAGLVHRDLKPENILVSPGPSGPVPRLVDFGLAVSVDSRDARLTESGMTMGTPAFAAPEQLAGKPVDHRADLYALGMTMFEMLTGGTAPFEGTMMAAVAARTLKDVPRLRARAPEIDVSDELEEVVARLTRRLPDERYANAREVIAALDAVRRASAPRVGHEVRGEAGGARDADDAPEGPEAGEARDVQTRHTTEATVRPPARPWRARAAVAVGAGLAVAVAIAAVAWPGASEPARREPMLAPAPTRTAAASVANRGPTPEPAALRAAEASAAPTGGEASGGESVDPREIEMESDAAAPSADGVAGPPARTNVKRRRAPREVRDGIGRAAPAAPSGPAAGAAAAASDPPAGTAPPAVATPELAPRPLRATLDGVDVSGSLPPGEVERAVRRQWSGLGRCIPGSPQSAVARFTIGEGRRARQVTTAGASAETNACVSAVLSDVQTEAAPDIGDVRVTVRIAFVARS